MVLKQKASTAALLISAILSVTSCGSRPNDPTVGAGPVLHRESVGWTSTHKVYDPAGQIYTYAPSVIVDGNTKHVFTCHNKDGGVIKDYIYYTKIVNGGVAQDTPVLSPSASGWDKDNVCDPSVVRTNVTYQGTNYSYVMFFLGGDSGNNHNAIGLAFAQNLDGPWVKYANNPIITNPNYSNYSYWGAGQQSATSVDGNGRILLVYKQENNYDGPYTYHREINLSNMAQPSFGTPALIPTAGLDASGKDGRYFFNIDIAYDGSRNRFYAIGEQLPFPSSNPNYLSEQLEVFSINSDDLWASTGSWRYEGAVTSDQTGFGRNHNGGIERDQYGNLPDPNTLSVMYAVADTTASTPLWTYDLWESSGALDNAAGSVNFVKNAGFENSGATQSPPNWYTWPGSSGTDGDADFTESGGHSGTYRGTHYKASNYEVYTGQDLSGLANGTYTLSAWVVSSGGQNSAYMEVKNDGGAAQSVTIPSTGWPNWQKIQINNVSVSNGAATVGFYSNAHGGDWLSFDDVTLTKQ